MATHTSAILESSGQPQVGGRGPAVVVQPRKAKPVKWWACLGGLFLAVEAYVLISFVFSGNLTATPAGPTPVPTYMKVAIRTLEFAAPVGAVVVAYLVLVRPWRRERHITNDGLLLLVFCTLFWQDSAQNFTQHLATVNSYAINFGSWYSNIPGWVSPHAHLVPMPPLWDGMLYVSMSFALLVPANWFMRKASQRWPQLGKPGLVGLCLGLFCIIDLIIEPVMMLLGFYTYPSSIHALTLFRGHYYQFPIYELLWPVTWSAWACLRYFRNDKGQTVVERGIDEVRATPRKKTGLRWLAMVGFCNVAFLAFNVAMQLFAVHADSWPEDIQKRSYFTNGLCGPGTTYACPGPDVPIPRRGSSHLSPSGDLVPR